MTDIVDPQTAEEIDDLLAYTRAEIRATIRVIAGGRAGSHMVAHWETMTAQAATLRARRRALRVTS